MKFTLESNIPVPAPRGGRKNHDWPFAEMKVGDSFFVPSTAAHEATVRQHVSRWSHHHPEQRFAVRKVSEPVGPVGLPDHPLQKGVRVFRVEDWLLPVSKE